MPYFEDDDPFYDLMARYDYYREAGFDTGDIDSGFDEDDQVVEAPAVVEAPPAPARDWEDDDIPF